MPRTIPEQERTLDEFLEELQKAPNAVEILRLFNRIMQDENETKAEFFEIKKNVDRIIANKNEVIRTLKQRISELCERSSLGLQRRRWN